MNWKIVSFSAINHKQVSVKVWLKATFLFLFKFFCNLFELGLKLLQPWIIALRLLSSVYFSQLSDLLHEHYSNHMDRKWWLSMSEYSSFRHRLPLFGFCLEIQQHIFYIRRIVRLIFLVLLPLFAELLQNQDQAIHNLFPRMSIMMPLLSSR